MRRRISLTQKQNLTKDEQEDLARLDDLVDDLPSAESPEDQSAMNTVRRAAKYLKKNW